jgi:hypothetical protein
MPVLSGNDTTGVLPAVSLSYSIANNIVVILKIHSWQIPKISNAHCLVV